MTASDDYCDFCDLPKSQCIHGRPPSPPRPAASAAPRTAPRPRKQATTRTRTSSVGTTPVNPRWTPPEALKPLILTVLAEAGGELEADELFGELETLAAERLLPGDHEKTPQGELRWHYAARRARSALIEDGVMTKGRPGVWGLAD